MIIGRGFGNFSYKTEPWTDPPGPQFNGVGVPVGVGTQIDGGSTGATITTLTVEPPHWFPGGSNASIPFRLLVLKSKAPFQLIPWQLASRGWPRYGDSETQGTPLWSKMYSQKTSQDDYTEGVGQQEPRTHFTFPKLSGPSVGPGETMSVLFMFMKNYIDDFANGQIHYGLQPQGTLIGFTVFGVYEMYKSPLSGNRDVTGRSIPRYA